MPNPPDLSKIIQQLENSSPPDFDTIIQQLIDKCPVRNLFTPGTAVPGLGNYECPARTAIRELER